MSLPDDLERLAKLHESGRLTDDEYRQAKDALLGGRASAEVAPHSPPVKRYVWTILAVVGVVGALYLINRWVDPCQTPDFDLLVCAVSLTEDTTPTNSPQDNQGETPVIEVVSGMVTQVGENQCEWESHPGVIFPCNQEGAYVALVYSEEGWCRYEHQPNIEVPCEAPLGD